MHAVSKKDIQVYRNKKKYFLIIATKSTGKNKEATDIHEFSATGIPK